MIPSRSQRSQAIGRPCPTSEPAPTRHGGAKRVLLPMLPTAQVEAQQWFPGFTITIRDIYTFGIIGALLPFQVSPKSVTLRARILLV